MNSIIQDMELYKSGVSFADKGRQLPALPGDEPAEEEADDDEEDDE